MYVRKACYRLQANRVRSERALQAVSSTAYRGGSKGKGMSARTLRNIRACLAALMKYCRSIPCSSVFPKRLTILCGAKPSEKPSPKRRSAAPVCSHDGRIQGKEVEGFTSRIQVHDSAPPLEAPFAAGYTSHHAYRFMIATRVRPGEMIALEPPPDQGRRDVHNEQHQLARNPDARQE